MLKGESKKKDDSGQEPSQALGGVPSRYGNPCVREQRLHIAWSIKRWLSSWHAKWSINQMAVAYGKTTRWTRVEIKYTEPSYLSYMHPHCSSLLQIPPAFSASDTLCRTIPLRLNLHHRPPHQRAVRWHYPLRYRIIHYHVAFQHVLFQRHTNTHLTIFRWSLYKRPAQIKSNLRVDTVILVRSS